MSDIQMTSSRPYLIRALYEWINDNGLTPHIVVDVSDERVIVPREFAQDGKIVLNLAVRAVGHFHWDNEWLTFSARFGGVSRNLSVPMWAILSIHARENGAGMMFGPAEFPAAAAMSAPDATQSTPIAAAETSEEDKPEPPKPTGKRPSLKVVK